jgi:hypothetical protein
MRDHENDEEKPAATTNGLDPSLMRVDTSAARQPTQNMARSVRLDRS